MADPKVGAATAVINPPLGASIPGYFEDRKVTGIRTDLLAKALVIEADLPLAILALDAIAAPRPLVLAIRQTAERELGIPGERVFVHATHTHTGGPVWGAFRTAGDEGYRDRLVQWSLEALAQAQRRAVPAEMGFGSVLVPGLQFNRRYWMKDGTVRTNPGIANPEVVRPAGPVNPEMGLLVFRRAASPPTPLLAGEGSKARPPQGEAPLALVVNFGLHLDTVGGTEIHADFPHYLSETVREALGEDTVTFFLNGCCGDINHLDVLGGEKPAEVTHDLFMEVAREKEFTPRAGRTLGQAALDLLPSLEFTSDWTVAEAHGVVTAAVRQAPPEQLERARAVRAAKPPEEMNAEELYDLEALRLFESGETEVDLEIQALRLGRVGLVGIPNEVFTELGQLIQAHSPLPHTLVVELANGCEGYLATTRAFAEGGYEIMLARSSKLAPETGEAVVAKAVEMLGVVSRES